MKKLKRFFYLFILVGLLSAVAAFAANAADAPSIEKFSVKKQGSASVTLEWEAGDATISGYKLYKYQKVKNRNTLITTLKSNVTSFKVTSLLSGTDYCFKLKAYSKSNGETVYSETLTLDTYTLVPKVTGLRLKSNSDVNQELTWDAIKGIKTYNIYFLSKSTGKFVLMGSKSENSASIKCAPATVYTYKVKAIAKVTDKKKTISGAASDPLEAVSRSALVSTFSVESKTSSSVTLKWDAAQRADGYKIYKYSELDKKYIAVKTVKNATSVTIYDLASATTYKFKIRSFTKLNGKNIFSAPSSALSITTKPGSTTVSQVVDELNNGKVKLKWSEASSASGYLIYVSDHKNSGFTLYKEVPASVLSTTVTGVKNGSVQYIKIKAYVDKNGSKVYGDYSTVISVYA